MSNKVEPAVTRHVSYGFSHTLCVKVSQWEWCFATEGFAWKWLDAKHGMNQPNLGLMQPEGDYSFQLYCKTLEEAVHFAWGFVSGWKARISTYETGRTTNPSETDAARKVTTEEVKNALSDTWKKEGATPK